MRQRDTDDECGTWGGAVCKAKGKEGCKIREARLGVSADNAGADANTIANTNASTPPKPNRAVATHLLLPAVHGLLVLLLVLEQQHINDLEVGDGAVPLKVLADLEADPGGGDVEGVESDDLGGL